MKELRETSSQLNDRKFTGPRYLTNTVSVGAANATTEAVNSATTARAAVAEVLVLRVSIFSPAQFFLVRRIPISHLMLSTAICGAASHLIRSGKIANTYCIADHGSIRLTVRGRSVMAGAALLLNTPSASKCMICLALSI